MLNHLGTNPHAAFAEFAILETVKPQEVITALAALASEPRLAAYRLLVKRGPKGYTPTELTERLGVPAPTLSFHLKELVRAGLVENRRVSRNLYYSPNLERMRAVTDFLTENCCSLADETCDQECRPLSTAAQKRRA